MKLTKLTAGVLTAALALSLAACSAASSSTAASSSAASGADTTTGAYTTGLGIVANAKDAQANTSAVALLIDADGVIVDAKLDVAQNSFSSEGGALALPEAYLTKYELGADYNMVGASGIGKEWFEQADAFCAYLIGMNAADVASIPTDGSDADLAAGCTVGVADYVAAAAKAVENAAELGAGDGDTLTLALATENAYGTADATADADGKAILETTIVAMTKNESGVVTSAILDKVQPTFIVTAADEITAPESVVSKLELGDDYGMLPASGIEKEWYEQSAAFCAFITGKTADEIAAIPVDGSDADLAAGCTISLNSLISTAAKAAQ